MGAAGHLPPHCHPKFPGTWASIWCQRIWRYEAPERGRAGIAVSEDSNISTLRSFVRSKSQQGWQQCSNAKKSQVQNCSKPSHICFTFCFIVHALEKLQDSARHIHLYQALPPVLLLPRHYHIMPDQSQAAWVAPWELWAQLVPMASQWLEGHWVPWPGALAWAKFPRANPKSRKDRSPGRCRKMWRQNADYGLRREREIRNSNSTNTNNTDKDTNNTDKNANANANNNCNNNNNNNKR